LMIRMLTENIEPRRKDLRSRPTALFLAALAVISILCSIPGAQGWGNGGYSSDPQNPDYGTHDWIADMALSIQTRDVTFLSVTYHSKYLLGTEAPDNPEYFGDSSYHHVYYHSDGSLQDDKSADRAYEMYQSALDYLTRADNEMAAYYIGAMSHYISDVAVFGHTMGSGTDWGSEIHHSDYESAFESIIGSLELPPGIALENLPAYDATVNLARDITFGKGDIKPNVWMDANYLWTDPEFEASAMASLYAAVEAVAAVINHLLIEYSFQIEPDQPPISMQEKPQPPRLLSATLQEAEILINWSPPVDDGGSPVYSYLVYRSTDTSNFSQVAALNGSVLGWTDNGIQQGKTYIYKMRARNDIGLSDFSNTVSVAVPISDRNSSEDSSTVLQIAIPSATIAICVGGFFFWRKRKTT